MKISETLRMVLTLVVICVVSAAALSLVYDITEPKIRENQLVELRATLGRSLPEAVSFDEPAVPEEFLGHMAGIRQVFVGLDEDKAPVGIAVIIEGPAYQDFIKLLVAVSPDMKEIKSVEILEQKETPGLGARIEEDEFLGQFKGEVKEEYDAITGATISSITVIDLVKMALEDLKSIKESIIVEVINEDIDTGTEAIPEWNETRALNETEENGSAVV